MAPYPVRNVLVSGIVAGLAATLLMVALRFVLGTPSLAEVVADRLTLLLPFNVFSFLLQLLNGYAKLLLFVSLLTAHTLLGGVLALGYVAFIRWALPLPGGPRGRDGLFFLLLFLFLAVVVTPLVGGGVFGQEVRGGALRYSGPLAASSAIFVLTIVALLPHRRQVSQEGGMVAVDMGRRTFLGRLALWGALVLGAGSILRLIQVGASQIGRSGGFQRHGEMSSPITPNDQFYIISRNLIDPVVPVEQWSLRVGGDQVERPFTLSYAALKVLPAVEEIVTLECIGDGEDGQLLMSNARWKGVRLRDLLNRAGLKPGVVDIAFYAWDDHSDSIPLELALQPQVIVAYEMNGVPLPDNHGFPARLLVPGRYGLKSIKWLTRIEPVDYDFKGHWQQSDWSDTAIVKTTSRFDVPAPGSLRALADEMMVGGVAFSGDRGIRKVEFKVDGESTGREATLEPALSPYSWVLWTGSWSPPGLGAHRLGVRATDGTDEVQPGEFGETTSDEDSGYHWIVVSLW